VLIASLVPIVAFKFFGFLGEQTVEALHSGAQSSIDRGREVAGRMNPQQMLNRVSTHESNGVGAQTSSWRDRVVGSPPGQHPGPGGGTPGRRPGSGPATPGGSPRPAGVGSGSPAPGAAAAEGGAVADQASEYGAGVHPATPAPPAGPEQV